MEFYVLSNCYRVGAVLNIDSHHKMLMHAEPRRAGNVLMRSEQPTLADDSGFALRSYICICVYIYICVYMDIYIYTYVYVPLEG